jgi:16S rRNA (cytosine967-C5)-methyltransferase
MDLTRKEAHQIILKVLKDHQKSEKLIDKALKKIKSDSDRAFLCHLTRGVIKLYKNLDYVAMSLNDANRYKKTDLKIKILLYLGIYQLTYCNSVPDHSAVNETVELAKRLFDSNVADYVNAVLRSYLRNPIIDYPEETPVCLAAKYSFDETLISEWIQLWGEKETEELCDFFNDVPKLSMRVNNLATDKKRLLKYFARKDIKVTESDFSENILLTTEASRVLSDVSFSEGYFSIQDSSAAMIVELLAPAKDESVLDLFAGPGGKCTYIAELMENTGEVIAVDRFPQKTKRIKQTIHRLQLTNINTITEDALKFGPKAPAYDKVLLDVPCTGWGVMQKKPELRWQFNQDIKSLLKLQENALFYGAGFVKEGGYLIYSTCTMNPAENEKQIENFLSKHKNFHLVDPVQFIVDKDTQRRKDIISSCLSNNYLQTLPHRDGIDGAFAAKMQKRS